MYDIIAALCGLPERVKDGKFCVLIITSGRVLHWPYRAKDDNPMYKTRKDAEKILKAYVKFTEEVDEKPRLLCEFEVVELDVKKSD